VIIIIIDGKQLMAHGFGYRATPGNGTS